jgi:UDP-N-acetyl-D-mannosaminuronate dehydrogenase
MSFKESLLYTKKISIWGIGYLGYTTILRLQKFGFFTTLYDFNEQRLDDLLYNQYPSKKQINTWSKYGNLPNININKIDVVKDIELLFENKVHIISFPSNSNYSYEYLAQCFIKNKSSLENSLVIFQSAGIPGSIDKEFCSTLEKNNINIKVASVFRSDWVVEDFFKLDKKRFIATNNLSDDIEVFLKLIDITPVYLDSIKDAEIYENTKLSINYMVSAFFNQLALSYPDINVNKIQESLFQDRHFLSLNIGASNVDFKSEQSIENLSKGSYCDYLSILKESNSVNISFLFYYADILKSKNINSVTILGLSSYNTLKDIRYSPSIIIAEYLYKLGIKVTINDENFQASEIEDILSFCKFIDFKKDTLDSDAIIVMSLCKQYKYFTQEDIESLGFYDLKYILDNTGFFENFRYSNDTIYHCFGDSNLKKVLS